MWTERLRRCVRIFAAVAVCALLASPAVPTALDAQTPPPPFVLPPIEHVFTIVLENQSFDATFGTRMSSAFLGQTAAGKGALLQQYYGTSHFSLGNYLSLISGQAVTRENQDDCAPSTQYPELSATYQDIDVQSIVPPYSQVRGDGCIYPRATKTVADQLMEKGLTWHGYMQDMGNDPTREAATCGQPIGGIGVVDNTQTAQVPPKYDAGGRRPVSDQYAARHNPFVYFHSLIDSGACKEHVGPLGTLRKSPFIDALRSVATTPNYVFITPNLCDDGHDTPCKAPNSPVGVHVYDPENAFLSKWVPIITRSPAFQKDGLLIITFDESSMTGVTPTGVTVGYDGSGCCNEPSGPNTVMPGIPPISAPQYRTGAYKDEIITDGANGISGGGRTGTVLLSPFIKPGVVTSRPYNHYSTLRTIEDIFGLSHLGYAGYPDTPIFGSDIFGTGARTSPVTL
jgi:hypothetical protein